MGDGLSTAVGLALGEAAGEDEAEQLDLLGAGLGLPERPRDEAEQPSWAAPAPPTRAPGRPPGARNKRTLAAVEWLSRGYVSPLQKLAEIYTTPVEELALRLGCTPIEALTEIRQAAIASLPYWHQRQAIAVDLNKRQTIHLTIETSDAAPGEAAEVIILENQPLNEGGGDEV